VASTCATRRAAPSPATTQLASGRIRFSSTIGRCLAIIRRAESVIRELAITMPSTWESSCSMVRRSSSGDSLVCERTSWYPASRAAS
jgi:hypothetical protein